MKLGSALRVSFQILDASTKASGSSLSINFLCCIRRNTEKHCTNCFVKLQLQLSPCCEKVILCPQAFEDYSLGGVFALDCSLKRLSRLVGNVRYSFVLK